MDHIENLDVELEKDHYYAGDALKGWVVVDTLSNVKLRGITVTIRGRVQVEWKVAKNGAIYTLHNCQLLFDNKSIIWGQDRKVGSSIPVLTKGHHRLPFGFQLPEGCLPCSFESKLGNIRYCLHVHMDVPYASPPQTVKYFTVIGPRTNLPQYACMVPIAVHKQEQTFCITCSRGNLGLDVSLERSIFCCGEHIPMQIEVTNGVNTKVWPIVHLIQHVEFVIDKSHFDVKKEVEHIVWEYKGPLVQKHSTMKLENLSPILQIPVMPPTTTTGCDLIHITYLIKVKLSTTKWGDALHVDLPIVIGTVPTTGKTRSYLTRTASACAEGGLYVSPELQLGQVYDGSGGPFPDGATAVTGTLDPVAKVLYQPVYVCVPHKKITLRNPPVNPVAEQTTTTTTPPASAAAAAAAAAAASAPARASRRRIGNLIGKVADASTGVAGSGSRRGGSSRPFDSTEVELAPTLLTSL